MATISTSITLKDRVSAVFKTITGSALESTKAIKGAGDLATGIVVSMIGAPYFMFLLLRKKA